MTISESFVDAETSRGPMRVHLFTPQAPGRYPGIISYSEIFQVTGPIRRLAAALAGEGYLVAVPEVYHEFEPLGTVLAYDEKGSARGNELKFAKELSSSDEDAEVVARLLEGHEKCSGRIGSFGVCLGGHLAVRAGFRRQVSAVAALYPTDIHTGSLGAGKRDDTLARFADAEASWLFIWGRQDPHVPQEGRQIVYDRLNAVEADFEWHEFNAAHAFLRDEGPRYNPAVARVSLSLVLRFFEEKLR